jgi:hypothetical protein
VALAREPRRCRRDLLASNPCCENSPNKRHPINAGRAITSVMPIDFFVPAEEAMQHMCPSPGVSMPPSGTECLADAQAAVKANTNGAQFKPLDR